ncbi:MAG: hypothetical protein EON93_12475, partial [Burkholderiales bacterium]
MTNNGKKSDYPDGITDADIRGALADEDFFDDFMPRQAAQSLYNRAARELRSRQNDPEVREQIRRLREEARLEALDANDPQLNKGQGVHRGQTDGAICRRLLVLSVYALHAKQGDSLAEFVQDHGLSLPAWQKWINDDEIKALRD